MVLVEDKGPRWMGQHMQTHENTRRNGVLRDPGVVRSAGEQGAES